MNTSQISRLKVTKHARVTMRDRDVRPEEVLAVLQSPQVVEQHQGRERYVRGDLVAVIAWEGDRPVLVTVLWRKRDQWTSAAMRSR